MQIDFVKTFGRWEADFVAANREKRGQTRMAVLVLSVYALAFAVLWLTDFK